MDKIIKSKKNPIDVTQYLGQEISILIFISYNKCIEEITEIINDYALANEGAYHAEYRYAHIKRPKTFVAMGKLIQEGEDYFLRRGCPGKTQFSIPIIPEFIVGIADIGETFDDEIETFHLK